MQSCILSIQSCAYNASYLSATYIGCILSISHTHIMYSIYQYMYIGCILFTSHVSQCEVYQPMSPADNFADVVVAGGVKRLTV